MNTRGFSYGRQSEEGDSQESEASSQEPSLPGTGGLIAVADSSQCYLGGGVERLTGIKGHKSTRFVMNSLS